MPAEYSPRQRQFAAFNHHERDRVPINIHAAPPAFF